MEDKDYRPFIEANVLSEKDKEFYSTSGMTKISRVKKSERDRTPTNWKIKEGWLVKEHFGLSAAEIEKELDDLKKVLGNNIPRTELFQAPIKKIDGTIQEHNFSLTEEVYSDEITVDDYHRFCSELDHMISRCLEIYITNLYKSLADTEQKDNTHWSGKRFSYKAMIPDIVHERNLKWGHTINNPEKKLYLVDNLGFTKEPAYRVYEDHIPNLLRLEAARKGNYLFVKTNEQMKKLYKFINNI